MAGSRKPFIPLLNELNTSAVKREGLIFSQHPFVVYNALRNCVRFTYPSLIGLLDELLELERSFKSSASDPQLLLEVFLIKSCAT
jgi:DNA polymerase III delta subunit